MTIRLLDDRVLVEPIKEETSNGGILIPTAAQEKSDTGRVEAAGNGHLNDKGERVSMTVKSGDKVIYSKYSGTEVKHNGKEYIIVHEKDILAIVE